MSNLHLSQSQIKALVQAGLLETCAVLAGVLIWALTGNFVWIAVGIVASLGFSLPAAIRLYRELKERPRASR